MTQINNHQSSNLMTKCMAYFKPRERWTFALAFAICVVSSIFMAGKLPVDDVMAAFGVFFIYFVTMMILAGLLRMAMGFYDKFSGSKS